MSPKLLPANNLDRSPRVGQVADEGVQAEPALGRAYQPLVPDLRPAPLHPTGGSRRQRAGEHTSELQSHSDLVCRLLLEKKNKERTHERDRPPVRSHRTVLLAGHADLTYKRLLS